MQLIIARHYLNEFVIEHLIAAYTNIRSLVYIHVYNIRPGKYISTTDICNMLNSKMDAKFPQEYNDFHIFTFKSYNALLWRAKLGIAG